MSDIKNMLTTWVDNETWVDSKNLTAINNVAVQMADDIEVLSRVAATTHSEVEAINEVMVGAEVYTDNSIEVEFPTLDRDMREVKEQVESIQTSLDNKANKNKA